MKSHVLLLAALSACKWTEFDDLKEEAWVNAFERPDNGASNWGVAVASSRSTTASGAGGGVIVLGTAATVFNEIAFDGNGGASVAPNEQSLVASGVANLDEETVLAVNPATDERALVVNTGATSVVVLALPSLTNYQLVGDRVGAATYVGNTVVVAAGTKLFGGQNPPCDTGTVTIRGLGTVGTRLLAWGSDGTLYVLNAAMAAAGVCEDLTTTPQVGVPFTPGENTVARILPLSDGNFAVIAAHAGDNSFISVVDNSGPSPDFVGTPQTTPKLRGIDLYDSAGVQAVVAGYPTELVDGVAAGKVLFYDVNSATGIGAVGHDLLHDSEPEAGQSFGRSVAVVSYNGKKAVAVAANNELFFYFRTGFYEDTREGR